MELTAQQIKNARNAASMYMMKKTVDAGSRYWKPRMVDELFKYALNAIGATIADASETRWKHFNDMDWRNWDLGHIIGTDLVVHMRWCGRNIRRAPYPSYH